MVVFIDLGKCCIQIKGKTEAEEYRLIREEIANIPLDIDLDTLVIYNPPRIDVIPKDIGIFVGSENLRTTSGGKLDFYADDCYHLAYNQKTVFIHSRSIETKLKRLREELDLVHRVMERDSYERFRGR